MKLFNEFGIDIGYVVLGMAGVILLMFIMLIVTMAKKSIKNLWLAKMEKI